LPYNCRVKNTTQILETSVIRYTYPYKMRFYHFTVRFLLCFILCVLCASTSYAQKPALLDSLNNRQKLLTELLTTRNLEKAQLEAEDFRWFIRRERLLIPVKAVTLISNIYAANKDEKSAFKFLTETELDARREKDIEKKSILLRTLIKEYERWVVPEKALECERLLSVMQDSMATLKVSAETMRWKKQLDSVELVRQREIETRGDVIEMKRDRAYTLAGLAGFVFLALLAANFMTADRWKKRYNNKVSEMEMEQNSNSFSERATNFQNQNERTPAEERAVIADKYYDRPSAQDSIATKAIEQVDIRSLPNIKPAARPWMPSDDTQQQKIALIIEKNTGITIYLKSILTDNFEVENAETANEGIQMANELLPDIIVCDAVLNGKSGIDVVRNIKQSEKTSHIPIILLTEKLGEDARLDGLSAGADYWFPRPLLDIELDEQINYLLKSRKYSQEHFARSLHLYFTENRVPIENHFLQTTLQLVEQLLPNPDFTAEDLARKMQMTKYHFFKKLNILTGKEPTQLIREMRLEKAKNLLEKNAAPVATIAELVGFTNPGTFSLAYKEYFGETTLLLQGAKRLNG
jgi:DNA-binding response OmpR family regulator